MANHVTALFRERFTAHSAVEQLVQAGFSRDDISVLMSDATHAREFSPSPAEVGPHQSSVRPAMGVLAAIVSELSTVGLVAAREADLLAAGPIAAALARADAIAVGATLVGALVAAGITDAEAQAAWEKVGEGGILVGVFAQRERAQLARELLTLSGGETLQAA